MKVLHVGCGRAPIHSYFKDYEEVRLDIDPSVSPDIVGDLKDLSLPDESYEAIYSAHNLEHLTYPDAIKALKAFRRILKPGGQCICIVPNLQACGEAIASGDLYKCMYKTEAGMEITAADMLYGHQGLANGNPWMSHKWGYTQKTMREALEIAGFTSINTGTANTYDLLAFATV